MIVPLTEPDPVLRPRPDSPAVDLDTTALHPTVESDGVVTSSGRGGSLLDPGAIIGTVADYIAALRRLRGSSGLTYRQLEGEVSADGAVLPSSAIATTLSRSTLPCEQFVEAFVRACGLDGGDAPLWIAARKRLAGDPVVEQSRAKRTPDVVSVLAVLGAMALLGGAGTGLCYAFRTAPASGLAVAGLSLPAVGSWAQFHPASTPAYCVAEGHDRSGRYGTEIAVQLACAGCTLPRTYLEARWGTA